MGKVPRLYIGTWQDLVEVIGVRLEEQMYAGKNEAAMWNTREAVIRVTMVEVDMPKWFQQKNRNRVEVYRVDNYELDYRSLRKDFPFLNFSSGDVTDDLC